MSNRFMRPSKQSFKLLAPTAEQPAGANQLTIDDLHQRWRISLAGYRTFGQCILDSVSLFVAQPDIGSANILFKTSHAARTRDGDHTLGAMEKPCQSKLRRGAALLLGNLTQPIGNGEIRGKLSSLKTRVAPPPVARRKIVDAAKPPAKKSPAQRALRHQRNTKFTQHRQETI